MTKKQLIILILGLVCLLNVSCIFVSKDSAPLAEKAHDTTEQLVPAVEESKVDESKTKASVVSDKKTDSMSVEQENDSVTEESAADKLVVDTTPAKDTRSSARKRSIRM